VTAVVGLGGLFHRRSGIMFAGMGGTVSRSVRWPLVQVAVSRPAGIVANQPSRTTRLPAGPSNRS